VAQRTAAERFLAAPAKTAGAGLCLALAAAVLAGCGGSSGDPGGASSASSTAGTAAAGSPDSSSSQKAKSPSVPGEEQGKDGGHPSSAGAPNGGVKKHATPVTLPKDESGREHAPTAAEKANSTIADMTLIGPSLPVAQGGIAALPATYTCDGADSWPALRWSGVPAASKELILYVMNARPVGGRLFFDWAVAGLDPSSESLEAGELPAGAVVGTNSFAKRGYSICPEPGGAETYIFALFALPRALSPRAGFDPRPLREEILGLSGDVGLLTAIYSRG
jgi:phosphatidylethanolamine-binding protein (PEBP) family uncharacterized protein